MKNEMIDTYLVAEDAKRVERAAQNSGKSLSEFISGVLAEAVKQSEAVHG